MPSPTWLRRRLFAAGLFCASVVSPMAARADISADQAQQLESQIRVWLATMLGPNVPLAARPIRVAPEGDHYRLGIEVAGQYGKDVTVSGDPISALVKPIDGTRWAVDDFRIPSPLRVENTGPGSEKFRSMATKIADQSATGVFDLSFATTSTLEATLRGYTSLTESGKGTQTTHVDAYTSHTTWQPTGTGRLNLLADGTGEGISTGSVTPDGGPVRVTAKTFTFTAHADDVAMDQMAGFVRGVTDLVPVMAAEKAAKDASRAATPAADPGAAKPGAPKPVAPRPATPKPGTAKAADDAAPDATPMPAAARAPLRAMLLAATGMMGALEEEYSLKDVGFDALGHTGTLRGISMGLGFGAPDGRVDVHMSMGLDGLDSPEIPPGVIHDFLPRHFSVKPRVSGVPSADVVALLRHAIDSDGRDKDALSAEALGLLAKGPLSVGIDDLALDAGPASLKGAGTVQITDPQTIAGAAQLRLTGYDALMQQASSTPMLQSAAPVLIFLKGIGKQDGDAVVWNIAYQDHKLLVNGTDLSAMMPSDSK